MKSHTLDALFREVKKTPIRVLIVADGIISFKADREFGLTELCRALGESATSCEEFVITTAHRAPKTVDLGADIPGFKFDMDPAPHNRFNRDNYEQVWLFGYLGQRGASLSKAELKTIDDFMNAGGGVFATGDHRDLGFAMCSEVPRVRSMRKWHFDPVPDGKPKAPDVDGPTRIDTLRQGRDAGFQFTDQSDDVPQEIRPKFFLNRDGKGDHPHPLLARGKGAITVLPDHMHEGECIVPSAAEMESTYSFEEGSDPTPEYPELFGIPARLAPEVVAVSTSAGGYLIDEGDVFPVEPRCFKVIVAYDGHLVERLVGDKFIKLGRVAVDASFHHFLNTNLNGTGSADPSKKGFYDGFGNPTQDYEAFKKYYRNLVTWLCPPDVQCQYYLNLLLGLRYTFPLIEEISPFHKFRFEEILFAGTATRNAIVERFSAAEAVLCTLALSSLLVPKKSARLTELVSPWRPPALHIEKVSLLSNGELFLKWVLGSAILGLAEGLPLSPEEAALEIDAIGGLEVLRSRVRKGLNQGLSLLSDYLDESVTSFERVKAAFAS